MINNLSWSYKNYFKQDILIVNSKVTFYQQVSFEILDDNNILKSEVKVRW